MKAFLMSDPEFIARSVEKLRKTRVAAIFMDEGEQRMQIALQLIRERAGRFSNLIWFAPFAILNSVRESMRFHAPDLETHCLFFSIEGISGRKNLILAMQKIDEDSFVVLDESHYIKMPNAKRSNRLIRLCSKSRYRLILSETPITQGMEDLYNQFYFLSARILGYASFYEFAHNHLEYSDGQHKRIGEIHNLDYIMAKIEPYTIHHFSRKVPAVPENRSSERNFTMSPLQKRYYQAEKEAFLEMADFDRYRIFCLFIRLQQILSGFYYSHPGEKPKQLPNNRLKQFKQLLIKYPDREKIVIWYKFRFDRERLAGALPRGEWLSIDSSMCAGDRLQLLEEFRSSRRFLLLNIKLSKYNLNLDMADLVIFYSNSFSYNDRMRAENLCYSGSVCRANLQFLDLIAANSIDEWILRSLKRKKGLVDTFREEFTRLSESGKKEWVCKISDGRLSE